MEKDCFVHLSKKNVLKLYFFVDKVSLAVV